MRSNGGGKSWGLQALKLLEVRLLDPSGLDLGLIKQKMLVMGEAIFSVDSSACILYAQISTVMYK